MCKPSVLHIQRHPTHFFSVERLFNSVRFSFPFSFDIKLFILPLPSRGFIALIVNSLSCSFRNHDVIHVLGDITYVASFLLSRNIVLTILDCVSLRRSRGLKRVLLLFFWFWLPIKRSKIVTVISNSVKDDVIKYVPCDPSKIFVVPVPLTIAVSPSVYAFNQYMPNILLVGTTENKNLERCLTALSTFKCKVHIIGFLSDSLLALLRELSIVYEKYYQLSDYEVIQRYISCDLLLFASTYEGFGMPIIEANAIGRPVITSNVSSMPEVAGDSAILVDPFSICSIVDGLEKVIFSSSCRQNLISNGFRNVLRFSPTSVARQYATLYTHLLS